MKELLIFAKYPEPGKVKTRLAKTLGDEKAAELYQRMVEKVVTSTKPLTDEYQTTLCYDPPQAHLFFQSWLKINPQRPQKGGDLGEKMLHAFGESLRYSSSAVLIGTDCLEVDRNLILKAFKELDQTDVVLGPAKDGGYYLIGCKKSHPELFRGIDWSTKHVFSQTLKIANALKLSVLLLPELEDIDTVEQYRRHHKTLKGTSKNYVRNEKTKSEPKQGG